MEDAVDERYQSHQLEVFREERPVAVWAANDIFTKDAADESIPGLALYASRCRHEALLYLGLQEDFSVPFTVGGQYSKVATLMGVRRRNQRYELFNDLCR